jgi:lipopolysaccharide export system protein LptA
VSAGAGVRARACRRCILAVALMCAAAPDAIAQRGADKGVPNALQGFSQNRNEPVKIEATSLEVRDKARVAKFIGNVKVVQGDTTMRCKSLVVFYDGQDSKESLKAAKPGPGGSQQISRLEARGGVIVTQKEQTATGDTGLFDLRANTVTLLGNVVVSQGRNVMRGDRLVVNLTTGVSRVDAGKSHGPVRLLIEPQSRSPSAPSQSPSRLGPPRPFSSN